MAGEGYNFDPTADLVAPLDYLILGFLNDEGTTFNDAYLLGHSAKQIAAEAFDGKVASTLLGPRLGALKYHGLVVGFKGIGAGGAQWYQVTTKGKQVLSDWKAKQGTSA